MDDDVKKPAAQSDDDILAEARERFRDARDADEENRNDALDDLKFVWNLNDYQWPESVKRLRSGRPCLTENRLPQFVRQIVNAQRMNRPSINVAPVDSQGDVQVANVLEGMVRNVEQVSKADLAYDNAFESAVSCGIGYFRIATRYVASEPGNQEVYIAPIDNPFSVYDDPWYSLPDASDRKWCFVTEWVDRKAFKQRYKVDPTPFDDTATGDGIADWADERRVQVAEYWRVNDDGSVEQFLLTVDAIIERAVWPGQFIPIIPVFGEVKNIEGRKWRKSLIRDVKSLQQANNFWFSAETESVALQPKAPWIGPAGAFETDETKWATANQVNHSYLQYDVVEGAPPPMRVDPPVFPAAIRETRMSVIEGMKSGMGIYDASLGARSNETSGVAIEARAQQGDLATYHFIDNMTRAMRYAGNVIIDLLPAIYDAPRVVRILAPDGEAAMVAVNQVFIDGRTMQAGQINLQTGRYDVVVRAGPSFQTQRQEASTKIAELVKSYPPLAQIAGDLLFKNLDIPEADKIAERMKPQSELPPQVQQQMQQMQQMIEQGKKYVAELEQKLQRSELDKAKGEIAKAKVELDLQAKIAQDELMAGDTTGEEMMRLRTDNAKKEIELRMKDLQLLEASLGVREDRVKQMEADYAMPSGDGEAGEDGEPATLPVANPLAVVLSELGAALQQFVASQEQLTRVLAADRVPIRGQDGRIAAVRTMLQ